MTWFILLNPENGEKVITEDEASYPGWTKIGEALRANEDFEEFDEQTGGYALNLALKAEVEELAEVTDRQRLRRIIRNLKGDVTTLKNRQAQLITAVQDLTARVATLEGS